MSINITVILIRNANRLVSNVSFQLQTIKWRVDLKGTPEELDCRNVIENHYDETELRARFQTRTFLSLSLSDER